MDAQGTELEVQVEMEAGVDLRVNLVAVEAVVMAEVSAEDVWVLSGPH